MDEPNQRRLQDTGQLIGHVLEIVRDLLQQRLALAVRHPGIGGVGQPGGSVVSQAVGREEMLEARRGGIALGQRPQAIQVLNSREQRGVIVDEYLAIQVFGRLYDAKDYWDGNWVDTEIALQTRGLGGSYWAGLRAEEFERLRGDLARMYWSLWG